MRFLNKGLVYEFTVEYKTSINHFLPGDRCNILNGVVVIDEHCRFIFDLNSGIARKKGRMIYV